MNPWYILAIEIVIFLMLLIGFVFCIVMFIKSKRNHKKAVKPVLFLSLDILLFICSVVFVLPHSTYYKFNDWTILNNNINSVYEKYGDFDYGSVKQGVAGKVGYYIYTDDGPIMPDHLPHYYWISYDEQGIIYEVNDFGPIGG